MQLDVFGCGLERMAGELIPRSRNERAQAISLGASAFDRCREAARICGPWVLSRFLPTSRDTILIAGVFQDRIWAYFGNPATRSILNDLSAHDAQIYTIFQESYQANIPHPKLDIPQTRHDYWYADAPDSRLYKETMAARLKEAFPISFMDRICGSDYMWFRQLFVEVYSEKLSNEELRIRVNHIKYRWMLAGPRGWQSLERLQ